MLLSNKLEEHVLIINYLCLMLCAYEWTVSNDSHVERSFGVCGVCCQFCLSDICCNKRVLPSQYDFLHPKSCCLWKHNSLSDRTIALHKQMLHIQKTTKICFSHICAIWFSWFWQMWFFFCTILFVALFTIIEVCPRTVLLLLVLCVLFYLYLPVPEKALRWQHMSQRMKTWWWEVFSGSFWDFHSGKITCHFSPVSSQLLVLSFLICLFA